MEINKETTKDLTIYYFGKKENASLSIIEANPQLQFTCEECGKKVHVFMALWDETMDKDFYLNAEMEYLISGRKSGIKCLKDAYNSLTKQYNDTFERLKTESEPNLKKFYIKTLTNIKAAINLIKWYLENHKSK